MYGIFLIQSVLSVFYFFYQVPYNRAFSNNQNSIDFKLVNNDSLFIQDSVLNITIKSDFNEILNDRAEKSSYHDALLELDNTVYTVELKTRGNYRRKKGNCSLPPLWLKFDGLQINNTVFSGYKKLKLVIPCFNTNSSEQDILKEYLAYKIYNLLTDYSFRVCLLKVTFVDLDNKHDPISRYAFFIEPYKALCRRVEGKELKIRNIHPNYTDSELITLMSVYQYMIGNTDWSVKALHNIKLISRSSPQKPVAVPYDFDNAGLVNAPYALPAEYLGVNSVTERVYNGYYRPIDDLQRILDVFIRKKAVIYNEVKNIQGLKKHFIDETIKYFDQFYKTLDHTKRIQYELIDKSRKD